MVAVIEPFDMVALAIAVVPIPTPIEGGELILIVADPLYPEPPFVMSNEDIVPAADTIAVTAAPTLISPEVISASIVLYDKL